MATAVIIGNGAFPKKEYPLYLLQTADKIVCCDGALASYIRYCKHIGKPERPDVVIGDMDSIPHKLAEEYRDLLVKITEQETNDQSKAFHYIKNNFPDVDTIHIIGATGKREDHTIGNLSLLMEYAKEMKAEGCEGINVDIVSDTCTAFAITDTCSIDVGEGREISILCPDNSLNIKSEGLTWKTDNVVFDNWWKATLNRASADTVTLTFSHPSVALIILN